MAEHKENKRLLSPLLEKYINPRKHKREAVEEEVLTLLKLRLLDAGELILTTDNQPPAVSTLKKGTPVGVVDRARGPSYWAAGRTGRRASLRASKPALPESDGSVVRIYPRFLNLMGPS